MTRDVIRPHLPVIFQELFGFVNQASTEILTLIMETFSILIAVILFFFITYVYFYYSAYLFGLSVV